MRYSYATISLPTLRPEQAVHALRRDGFQGIEWKVGSAPQARASKSATFMVGNLCTLEQSASAGQAAAAMSRAAGLTIVGLTPYVRSGDLAHLRAMVDMAVAAGTSQIRLQGPRPTSNGPSYSSLATQFLDFLGPAVAEASRRGVRLVIEIHHKTIVPSVGLVKPFLDRFNAANLGVIYDVGNMVFEGYEDHRMGVEILGPYLHHVHLKNARPFRDHAGRWAFEWSALDDGIVDVADVLDLLHNSGYEGWVSLEDLSTVRDPLATMHYNAALLTRLEAPGWQPPTDVVERTA